MAPKVKTTTQSLDIMEATQADSLAEKPPEEELETQCTPDPDAPPKKNRGRPKAKASATTTTKRRRKQAPLVKNVISKNILVHPHIVQQVLNEFEKVCLEHVKTKSVLRTRLLSTAHDAHAPCARGFSGPCAPAPTERRHRGPTARGQGAPAVPRNI